MEESLFDIPETKSPRLIWMEKHGIKTERPNPDYDKDDEDEFGWPLGKWMAFTKMPAISMNDIGWGDTEDEAITQLALKLGIKLWNEEGGSL